MSEGVSRSGPSGPSPHDKKMYEQEYKHGADLFDKALDQYEKSDNSFQKAEFKDVMDKAMRVMNDSAQGLIRKDLEEQNQKIAKDYETFQKYPGDEDTSKRLHQDLDDAKQTLDKRLLTTAFKNLKKNPSTYQKMFFFEDGFGEIQYFQTPVRSLFVLPRV